jgi:Protein of unknown function (DUF1360)
MGESSGDPRPLHGYEFILGSYAFLSVTAVALLKQHKSGTQRLSIRRLVLMAVATQHLSRVIAKDSVLAPLRAPFTRFVEPTGEGEVMEEAVGHGLRHAIGELLTCPYCLAQWTASGLVAGTIAFPNLTEALTAVCTVARVSDYLQVAYDHLKSDD